MSQKPVVPAENISESSASLHGAVDQALIQIRDALKGLEYGVLSVIVQDGVVVQIERTERKRLRRDR